MHDIRFLENLDLHDKDWSSKHQGCLHDKDWSSKHQGCLCEIDGTACEKCVWGLYANWLNNDGTGM